MNSDEQHKQDKKNSSWQGGLIVIALMVAALAAVADTYGKEVVESEVPVPVVEPEPKKGWWPWKSPIQVVKDKLNVEEILNVEIEALNVQLQQANAKLLGFDSLLDAASAQNDRTVSHFEGLLEERDRDVEAYRNQN